MPSPSLNEFLTFTNAAARRAPAGASGCRRVPTGASGCQRVPLEGGSQTGSCELAVGCKAASNCTVQFLKNNLFERKFFLAKFSYYQYQMPVNFKMSFRCLQFFEK